MSIPSASTPFSSLRKFNVTDIRSRISGVSYLSKFYFRLLPTIGIVEKSKIEKILDNQKMKDIFIYANNVTVPQRAIDGENYTYSNGYRVNFPTTTSYGDGTIGINVRMDESYKFYDMFIQWMDIIHNKKTGHLSFYDDYVCDIEIFQLSYTNMDNFVSSPTVKGGRSNADLTIATYDQFLYILEGLSAKSNVNADHYKRTRGGTNNYSRFIIRNCYPKTISSIEFSHESQEKVNCLVNFAYEGIDYDVYSEPKKEEGFIALSRRRTSSSNSNREASSITSDNIDAVDFVSPSPKSGRSITGQPTDSSGSKWSTETIVELSKIANQAKNSLIYESSVQEKLGDNQSSFLLASTARNLAIAAQNDPVFAEEKANSSTGIGKEPSSDQKIPKVQTDPITGRVTNMQEILDAYQKTANDPEYGPIMSELGYDDVQLGIQRDIINIIDYNSDIDDEIIFSENAGEHSGIPADIHDEYDDLTSYNKVTSIATSAGKSIQEKIDSGDAVASLLVSSKAVNSVQNRNELIELLTMTNLAKAAQNDPVFAEEKANSSTGIGKVPSSDQKIPEVKTDPVTGKITNRGEIVEAFNRNAADPEYNSIMNNINVDDILDDIDRDISVIAVQDIPVPVEIKEIDVYPPPTHKNISIPHAVADNIVKLELRANNLKGENHQIDTTISSNDSQISTLQSEINTLEASISGGDSSGNAGAIGAQITQKQSLINQIQQENTSLLNDKIDNEGEIADMNDLINKNIIIQNSNLSVDDQTRVQNNGQRVTVLTDIEYQDKIDAIMDDELPEEVQPTLMVALGAADLNLQHKKIYGTPEEIEAAQAEYDSLIEVEVNDGFPE